MPFGLKNAPGRFNNFITQEVLSGFMNEFVRSYLDDFVIYSSSWEEHLVHLNKVFERLRVYQLTCSVKKCFFGKESLEFLGHQITSDGNKAKPEHVRAIITTSSGLQSAALGACRSRDAGHATTNTHAYRSSAVGSDGHRDVDNRSGDGRSNYGRY